MRCSKDSLIDLEVLGGSLEEAKVMVKKDKVRAKKKRENEKWMKDHNVTVADMAGCMH
jgi:hypothetical protein